MYPRKLYVEITTRCNMQCGMCVKHVPGSCISNTNMDFSVFSRLRDSLPHLAELVLNGIGEPLLHPDILKMVSFAADHMAPATYRGFQTNGLLLTRRKTEELLTAGLNQICISADSSHAGSSASGDLLHRGSHSDSPFELVNHVRRKLNIPLRLGAEIVLVRQTLPELPSLVRRLAEEGVDFIIASHILSYQPGNERHGLFDTNTAQARELYKKCKDNAEKEGLDLASLTSKTWIAPRRDHDHHLKLKYDAMLRDAREQGVWLHVKRLEEWDEQITRTAEEIYLQTKEVAAEYGVELDFPPLTATTDRCCRFIKNKAAFINTEGEVMPCHALWHDYTVYMNGDKKRLHQKSYGNITDRQLTEVWRNKEYSEFRDTASRYEFPFCHSCTPGPCPDITGEFTPFINDCFGLSVPCGHCLWCLDAVRCL